MAVAGQLYSVYQQNYFENALRIPIYPTAKKLIAKLKEEEREVDHQTDGKINSPNPETGTVQKA
jgi:hypothetical protein